MCYIQLSLLGCAGYVVVGDAFSNPIAGSGLTPIVPPENDIWFTPMLFSPIWVARRHTEQSEQQEGE
jgi:hypothetical protein